MGMLIYISNGQSMVNQLNCFITKLYFIASIHFNFVVTVSILSVVFIYLSAIMLRINIEFNVTYTIVS